MEEAQAARLLEEEEARLAEEARRDAEAAEAARLLEEVRRGAPGGDDGDGGDGGDEDGGGGDDFLPDELVIKGQGALLKNPSSLPDLMINSARSPKKYEWAAPPSPDPDPPGFSPRFAMPAMPTLKIPKKSKEEVYPRRFRTLTDQRPSIKDLNDKRIVSNMASETNPKWGPFKKQRIPDQVGPFYEVEAPLAGVGVAQVGGGNKTHKKLVKNKNKTHKKLYKKLYKKFYKKLIKNNNKSYKKFYKNLLKKYKKSYKKI